MKIAGIKTVLLLIACFFIVCFTSKAQSMFGKIDSEAKNPKLKEFNMQDKGWWCAVEIHAGMVWYGIVRKPMKDYGVLLSPMVIDFQNISDWVSDLVSVFFNTIIIMWDNFLISYLFLRCLFL